ncbi:unnamed protein product (macronuclear) [Paramecium tetraurelia]|uniref:RRM domain-containing protein n=1 Tax=Paramecium tetraurelia TaxID=5888 RepID=A0CPB8_PARTE|nr:uncharacterized protein GSPATT00009026001 [Paramecium tetraurelia]CAK72635.1 unnamed protein product [Paramecium tetraurelia]|eukprot:XP_001440032.1 hypothetical protein (macronuclear) [Paramecium tetraurelia strain d4-2]
MFQLCKSFYNFSKLKVFANQLTKSIDNAQKNVAFAYFLPKDWNEKQVKEYFDPQDKLIKRIQLIKDSFDNPTGKAIIEMESESIAQKFIKEHHENYIDTKDVLQQIVVKPFSLKKEQNKLDIKRSDKQAYITGLPRQMKNEELLDLLIDFGEIEKIQIPKDQNQEFNKGYAFVLFKKVEDAQKFQTFMNGKEFMGKKLSVQLRIFRFDSQKKSFKTEKVQDGDVQYEQNKANYGLLQKEFEIKRE